MDPCWVHTTGYGNNWDYAIGLKYKGVSQLTFKYRIDSELNFDSLLVEADTLGRAQSRVNSTLRSSHPEDFWLTRYGDSGRKPGGVATPLISLPTFGQPDSVHIVWIRFRSNKEGSDEDGAWLTTINAGLVVDDINVTGQLTYMENFEGTLNPNVMFQNVARTMGLGEWARMYSHVTDNDKCVENTTCSWLFTDPTRGAQFANRAFGPDGAVVRDYIDNAIVSPWITTQKSTYQGIKDGFLLSFREFPGNDLPSGQMMRGWAVRGKRNGCITQWSNDENRVSGTFQTLDDFTWVTRVEEMTDLADTRWDSIQVRFRVADYRWLFGIAESAPNPGPGPYIDRVRIARVPANVLVSVGDDSRSQAQDAFACSESNFAPTMDPFGTCAFSMAADLGIPSGTGLPGSSNVIIGDSIVASFFDPSREPGVVINKVALYFAITEGPHAGKTPLNTTKVRDGLWRSNIENPGVHGPIPYSFDFDDDTYFRGGDVVKYFWWAGTTNDRFGSSPPGINLNPLDFNLFTIETAELLTGGLWEVNFLPKINWDPDFLSAILLNGGPGDFNYYDPAHPEWRDETTQANAILYVNKVNTGRRSGSTNRTSFMWTLDALGYKGRYDVYDVQGFGNTNIDLGSRATTSQAFGYALIIHDVGRLKTATIPDGSDWSFNKVAQAQWYTTYLEEGGFSGIPHSLWVIGENWASEQRVSNHLVQQNMAIDVANPNQTVSDTPNARGVNSFTFHDGWFENFSNDADDFCLAGGCPSIRDGRVPSPVEI